MRLRSPLLPVLLSAAGAVVSAQDFPLSTEPEAIHAVKFATPPQIDGVIGEEEWAGIGTIRRTLVIGGTNQPSGERGQVWIGYDDTYIYIAARIWLARPDKVIADAYRDNASFGADDTFFIEIDTFGLTTDESSVGFNANGATRLNIAGGRAAKLEWSGRVEGGGRITETGWEGEVRVPWALIPTPAAGLRDMKFDFDWYVSATGRGATTHTNSNDPTKVHQLLGVELPQIDRSTGLLLLPYAYVGYNDENGEHIANAGLDFKASVTQDLNLVGTVNPDFRNIEGDILSLDFSNFERLRNETRPFFQEGDDYYFFGHGRRIFASQRIRAFDAGVNVYGNLGGKSRLGVLGTLDVNEQGAFAGSYTYNPDLRTELTWSFAALQRVGEDNTSGRFAADRRFGPWDVFIETSMTNDQIEGTGTAFSTGLFYNVPGWGGRFFYDDVSGDFFPRIGFAAETNFKGYSFGADREIEFESGPVTTMDFGISVLDYERRDGSHYRERFGVGGEVLFKNLLAVGLEFDYEHFENRHDHLFGFGFEYPEPDPYRNFGAAIEYGRIENATYHSFEAGVRYRPVKRLQLSLSGQAVQHTEDEEQIIFNFNYEIGKYDSFGGRVVYNEREWNWYASYRRSGNYGAEYYIIVGDPNADSFQKTLIFKMSVPFTIG